jgi:4-carboxymuconolactone decarboxylase
LPNAQSGTATSSVTLIAQGHTIHVLSQQHRSNNVSKSETYKKGAAIRRELMGDAFADKLDNTVYKDPTMAKFGDYANEAIFGMLWGRPGLDHKTRALICVISDTCGHCWPELELHIRFARGQGWTEDELTEVLLHLGGYIGVPSIREAMIIASKVFKELREEEG